MTETAQRAMPADRQASRRPLRLATRPDLPGVDLGAGAFDGRATPESNPGGRSRSRALGRRLLGLLALVLLLWSRAVPAQQASDAAGMQARYTALGPQLRSNVYQMPLYLESSRSDSKTQGDAYAVLGHPFAAVSAALGDPTQWCGVLMLHLNTKSCRARLDGAAAQIEMKVGRKFDEPDAGASVLAFAWRAAAIKPDYMDIELDAPSGPFGTRDYRIVFEAVPIDADRTFIHLGYAFGYGMLGRLAMDAYLATAASDKVGFTVTTPASAAAPAEYVHGSRGLVERNTMRYYLAIDAYLGALALPPAERLERMIQTWFAATERYPRQLHELDQASYLQMKRNEYGRLQRP